MHQRIDRDEQVHLLVNAEEKRRHLTGGIDVDVVVAAEVAAVLDLETVLVLGSTLAVVLAPVLVRGERVADDGAALSAR